MKNFLVSYHLLGWTNTLAWTNKHTSLLRSLYITDRLCFLVQGLVKIATKRFTGLDTLRCKMIWTNAINLLLMLSIS